MNLSFIVKFMLKAMNIIKNQRYNGMILKGISNRQGTVKE